MSDKPLSTQVQGVFVNLPVADLAASKRFFESLGFAVNPQFTDDTAACLVLGPSHYAMLIGHARFKDFTPYERVDAQRQTEVLVALQLDSRAAVEQMMQKALAAGGKHFRPAEDHGWMKATPFRTWMGTSGNPSSWTWPPCRPPTVEPQHEISLSGLRRGKPLGGHGRP